MDLSPWGKECLTYVLPTRNLPALDKVHRTLVVTEVDVFFRSGRLAAPLPLYFGAQREHRLEAFHVESRVRREAEARLHQSFIGPLGRFGILLQAGRDEGDHLSAVRGCRRHAHRFYVRGDVALEQRTVRTRPAAHHERSARLVGTQEVDRAAKALQPPVFRGERERWIEHSGGVLGAFLHSLDALRRTADRLHRIILAFEQPGILEDFFRQQRVGGVGRVDDHELAADVRERADLRTHHEFVHAGVPARHDDHVLLRELDHRHRIVHRGIRDLERYTREPIALRLRVRGELQLDLDAALLEHAVGDAQEERRIARGGKGVDPHERGLLGGGGRGDRRQAKDERNQQGTAFHRVLPVTAMARKAYSKRTVTSAALEREQARLKPDRREFIRP